MDIGDRIKILRKTLKLTQAEFAAGINLKATVIGMYENKQRNVLDRNLALICIKYNVNENWLRYGTGNMFIEKDTITLDDYAKKNNLSEIEYEIIKLYMGIDPEVRKKIVENLRNIFLKDKEKNTNTINLKLVSRGGKTTAQLEKSQIQEALQKDMAADDSDDTDLF